MSSMPSLSRQYRRVVQLELNELSRPIIDELLRKGLVPGFAAAERDWLALTTTSEEEYEQLEPWIQWTTAHTGKTFAEHSVFRLGDARHAGHPQTWEMLSEQGIESAILGSMNGYRGTARGGVFFPDPWAKENDTHPESLRSLWSLISRRVKGHVAAQPGPLDAVRGALACFEFGVPAALQARIAAQVVRQRIDRRAAWRLAALFDEFLFEIFLRVLETTKFGYYTLFLNAVAHYQHHFWRQFDREGFDPKLSCPDCHPHEDPVLHGYLAYDRMLQRVQSAVGPDTLVIVVSGLSQVPFRDKEPEGGCNYWRLRDHAAFARLAGLETKRVYPMMSRDWQLEFDSVERLEHARAALERLKVGGESLFLVDRNQPHGLFVETKLTRGVEHAETIVDGDRPVARFHEQFVCCAIKSGKHVGEGVLWLSDREARTPRRIPLTALHHTVLSALGVHPSRDLRVAPTA